MERLKQKRKAEQAEKESSYSDDTDILSDDKGEVDDEDVIIDEQCIARRTRNSPNYKLTRCSTEKFQSDLPDIEMSTKAKARRSLEMSSEPPTKVKKMESTAKGKSAVGKKGKSSHILEPSPSTSKGRSAGKQQKQYTLDYLAEDEKLDTSEADVSSDYQSLREHQPRHMDKKKKTVSEVLEGRDKYYEQISKSVIDLTKAATAPKPVVEAKAPIPTTAEDHWASMLVVHMARMPLNTRDEFMVHVHGMALRAVRGEWPDATFH